MGTATTPAVLMTIWDLHIGIGGPRGAINDGDIDRDQDPKDGATVSPRVWVVTALHVIRELKRRGVQEVILRLNPKDPANPLIAIPTKIDAWFSHPTDNTVDVAIFECGVPGAADHLVIPLSFCVTDKTFKDNEVNLGDEVFVSGFCTHHFGNKRNLPIVRTGTLAALNDEKISTDEFGDIEDFLSKLDLLVD